MHELLDTLRELATAHRQALWALAIGSVAVLIACALALPAVIAALPADFYQRPPGQALDWLPRHPALRLAALVVKNAAGAVLVLAGIAMLFLPGQGILTLLAGLALLDFPGKRRLELAILRRRAVRAAVDWLRRRAGKEPLRL